MGKTSRLLYELFNNEGFALSREPSVTSGILSSGIEAVCTKLYSADKEMRTSRRTWYLINRISSRLKGWKELPFWGYIDKKDTSGAIEELRILLKNIKEGNVENGLEAIYHLGIALCSFYEDFDNRNLFRKSLQKKLEETYGNEYGIFLPESGYSMHHHGDELALAIEWSGGYGTDVFHVLNWSIINTNEGRWKNFPIKGKYGNYYTAFCFNGDNAEAKKFKRQFKELKKEFK